MLAVLFDAKCGRLGVATYAIEASASRSAVFATAMFVICAFLKWQKLAAEARVAWAVALAIVTALRVASQLAGPPLSFKTPHGAGIAGE